MCLDGLGAESKSDGALLSARDEIVRLMVVQWGAGLERCLMGVESGFVGVLEEGAERDGELVELWM